jgi:nanoRNase/pAp phosphatase (c-di-AMP/oligoRNAs hydrolase)
MALNPKQQAYEMVKKSSSPLILIPENPEGDAVASALALFLILKKINKNPQIACSKPIAEKFLFFPAHGEIRHSISNERAYKISLEVGNNEIKELSYEQVGNMLNVKVITDYNNISKESLILEPSNFKYDLLLTLSSPDLESLGKIYFDNTELFFQTPIINIDNHPSNEYFGTVNLVEVTSASASEIITEFKDAVLTEKNDEDITTLLLAGIIAETNNFQSSAVNPSTFSTAASLLAAGARQEEIIKNFYKTKPLSVLKLIGQIVNNMSFDPEYSLAWAKLSQNDFEKNNANPHDIDMAINELVNNSKDIDILLITYQNNEKIIGNIWMDRMFDAKTLTRELNGEKRNHKIIVSTIDLPVAAFEEKTLAKLKTFVKISQKRIGAIE